jgi:hypothetical protein
VSTEKEGTSLAGVYYNTRDNFLNLSTTGRKTITLLTNAQGTNNISIRSNGDDYVNLVLSDFKIELGSSATPYTPFRGMQTVHIPYTLRSLPDGTRDYIEINHKDKTAQFVKNIDTIALDWNKNWTKHTGGDLWLGNMVAFVNFGDYNFLFSKSPHVKCTHFELLTDTRYYYYFENVGFTGGSWIGFKFFASYLGITSSTTTETAIALFKSWLEQQSLVGNPVTMQYALTDPVITELDYEAVKTYYPYTQIYTTATVQPTLDGKFRVWGS